MQTRERQCIADKTLAERIKWPVPKEDESRRNPTPPGGPSTVLKQNDHMQATTLFKHERAPVSETFHRVRPWLLDTYRLRCWT